MTDNKDDASKSPLSGNPQPGKPVDPKRPHATIDLRAIEVPTPRPEVKPAADAAKSATPPGSAQSTATTGSSASLKPGEAKPNETKPAAAASAAAASASATAKAKAAAPVRAAKPAGIGGVASHMMAGVIGGAMAWYGITALGPQLGLPVATDSKATTDALQLKLAALEKSLGEKSSVAAGDIAAKLKAAEEKLARLDGVSKTVGELTATQAKLAADTKAMTDKLADASGTNGTAARIAKLEEHLKLMSEAAAGDPQAGKLPQIAAISGRLVDLESTLTNQLSALRKTVSQEMEQRLSLTNETSEAAKSGTNRVDRELATVKSDAAASAEKIDKVRTDADRLTVAVQGIREESGSLKSALEGIKSDVEAKFKAVAKPADVALAVAPMAGKLSSLEQNVQSVVKSEAERKTNSGRILLALELNNLKRVLDRGQPYAAELGGVTKAAGGKVDLTILERYKDTGIATAADLTREFSPVANAIIDASSEPVEGSLMDRMLAGAKSVIRVRKIAYSPDDKSAEAIVGRMEAALKDGRMMDVLAEAKNIPAKAQGVAQDWLVKVEARGAVDRAIAGLEAALKTSIAGGAGEAPASAPAAPAPAVPPSKG